MRTVQKSSVISFLLFALRGIFADPFNVVSVGTLRMRRTLGYSTNEAESGRSLQYRHLRFAFFVLSTPSKILGESGRI